MGVESLVEDVQLSSDETVILDIFYKEYLHDGEKDTYGFLDPYIILKDVHERDFNMANRLNQRDVYELVRNLHKKKLVETQLYGFFPFILDKFVRISRKGLVYVAEHKDQFTSDDF
ncbi:hypothetical protein HYV79_01285 [Candidatus Woesearchaeota archaeon]|nr:hypothetical protein [Candidatus Woesearchaeota archaeon]